MKTTKKDRDRKKGGRRYSSLRDIILIVGIMYIIEVCLVFIPFIVIDGFKIIFKFETLVICIVLAICWCLGLLVCGCLDIFRKWRYMKRE